jgi:tetratricopeptide (TPR) repeat protein
MAAHLRRDELKRNELGEAVGAGVEYAGVHLRQIAIGVAAVVAVVLIIWGIFAWRAGRDGRANAALGRALTVANAPIVATGAEPDADEPSFASESARDQRARELFEALARDFGSTGAGSSARLWLAQLAARSGDAATARRHWQEYLDVESSGALAAAARRNLIHLDRAEGKGEALVAELSAALERGRDPLPPDALLWELAQTQSALGRDAEARAAYQKIVDEHPASPWLGDARRELAEGRKS